MGFKISEEKRKDVSTEKEQIVEYHGLNKFLRRLEIMEAMSLS